MLEKIEQFKDHIETLKKQITRVFVGKNHIIDNVLIGFIGGMHVLIEDIPGIGKTTLAKSLAKSSGLDFGRIQFTPDLLPGDIIGMTTWSIEKKDFVFKPGAILHQFILADEINRASARTQASMLEAMQEEAVTIDDRTYPIPQPFFVIATQNPSSFAGTFKLPVAQLDRFGISFSLGYPDENEEMIILERFKEKDLIDELTPVIDAGEIIRLRERVRKIYIENEVKRYIIKIAKSSRKSKMIKLGMSPRGTQHLLRASQVAAMLNGRDFVIPEDVISVAHLVIPHKLVLSAEAKMENIHPVDLINKMISDIAVPTGTN